MKAPSSGRNFGQPGTAQSHPLHMLAPLGVLSGFCDCDVSSMSRNDVWITTGPKSLAVDMSFDGRDVACPIMVGCHVDLFLGRATGAGRRHPAPPRSVRKTLFTFQLWRPARHRQPAVTNSSAHLPGRVQGRSADRSFAIGWLNSQSLRNTRSSADADNRLDAFISGQSSP